jgi:CubicO group peptidase (beta-lactamase class C family)
VPNFRRTCLGVLIALALVTQLSCSADKPDASKTNEPTSSELAEALQGYADVVIDFDEVRAVVVARGDEIVHEQYFGSDADAYWGLQSVTKSFVSTLVGIAVEEGLIGGVDDTLEELLPQYADAMSPAVRATTLRELLTMTAGFPGGQEAAGPAFTQAEDWVKDILATPEAPPGGAFLYSNGTSHLLAAILAEATGSSPLDYAKTRLLDPLGIDTSDAFTGGEGATLADYDQAAFAWPADPQGVSTGWWGLKLTARDLVKFGQLYLAGGRWEGTQVVPEDWVTEATRAQVDTDQPGIGYGYQWWVGDIDGARSYRAMGYGGELLVVVPSRDLVVVTLTEVRASDPSSHGVDIDVMMSIVEDAVVAKFSES